MLCAKKDSVPVWAKVLAFERLFCSPKESDFSNRDSDALFNYTASSHLVLKSAGPALEWRCTCGTHLHQPRGPTNSGDFRTDKIRIRLPGTTQHSPNIQSSPCSNHREPVPSSDHFACVSYPHLQIRPSHEWANVSASSPLSRPVAIATPPPPFPWPLKWISFITLLLSLGNVFIATSLRAPTLYTTTGQLSR